MEDRPDPAELAHVDGEIFNRKKLVYICSPFSGDEAGNAKKARRYSRFAFDRGAVPIAPHLLFPQFMDERTERGMAMQMDMVLLEHCGELWVFGGIISEGMRAEIARAEEMKIRIRYYTEEMEERRC